jgi:hypothetical protein
MIIKTLLTTTLFLSFSIIDCLAEMSIISSLSLKVIKSDAHKGTVEVRPFKNSKLGIVQISGFNNINDHFYVVKHISRVGKGYHLKSLDNGRVILSKGNKRRLVKGSTKDIFELNLSEVRNKRLIAVSDSKKNIYLNFKNYEYPKYIDWKKIQKKLKMDCKTNLKVSWDKNLNKQSKKRSLHFIKSINELCINDIDYRLVISKLRKIHFNGIKGSYPIISKNGAKLTVGLAVGHYSLAVFSRYWLTENL